MNQQQINDLMSKLDKLVGVPDSIKLMEASIKGVEGSILNMEKKLDDKLDNYQSLINKKITEISNITQRNSKAISVAYNELSEELDGIRKSTEILVASFPANLNVPMNELYQRISSAIGFRSENDASAAPIAPNARLINIKNAKLKTCTILIRFATILDKNAFMANYFKDTEKFNLKNMGFTEDQRLYISHNLTPNKYRIFKAAIKHKKDKKLNAVRVSDYGEIKIRMADGAKFQLVKTLEDLQKLIPQGESSNSSNSKK